MSGITFRLRVRATRTARTINGARGRESRRSCSSPHLKGPFVVDNTQYDTMSILATIEQKYGLAALSSRDAAVNSLSNVFDAH